ncbi:DUF1826 domain-containing protein [Kaistella haifensis]|nr:DUF1826 domain-containing protein [Kaistella haifensis]
MNSQTEQSQIKTFSTFDELVNNRFQGNTNAFCWQRNLDGDFGEIVAQLQLLDDITEISKEDLLQLELSEPGNRARQIILNDIQLLENFGAAPSLNLLKSYERDDEFNFMARDVYSFHVDRSPIAADTYLCTYFGASSDIVPNHQATQKILIPEIINELKTLHQGHSESFETFLEENFFDLHYEAKPNATPINLGNGHLWRLAVDHPFQEVLPCIHRAPKEKKGEYRLLLIC